MQELLDDLIWRVVGLQLCFVGKNNTTRWDQKCGCDCFTCPIANEQAALDDARILLRFVVISYYVYIYIYII